MEEPKLLQVTVTIPRKLEELSIQPARETARRKILDYISQQIAMQMYESRSDESVELSLKAYIVTPSQLSKMVQQRAEQMHKSMPTFWVS